MLAEPSRDSPVLREARGRALQFGRPVLASWTQPASAEAISFFSQASGAEHRALWLRPSTGEALVGVGAAYTLLGSGVDRFQQVSAGWRALLSDAVVDDLATQAGQQCGGPLLLGGFSFDPLHEPSTTWDGFPDARMVLPEHTLVVRDGAAWLTTNVVVGPAAHPHPQAGPPRSTDYRSRRGVAHRHSDATSGEQIDIDRVRQAARPLSAAAWQGLVAGVARGIRFGHLGVEKVVLARAVEAQASGAIEPHAALRTLAASYPTCTVFAVAHDDACFLGATPERLISLNAGTATTMALAGSVSRGATPAEDDALAQQLFHSSKERAEHAFVVGALRDGLATVCTRLIGDTQPRVRKLANLQHLYTPIHGQVAAGYSVLDLVERLHPTPAVGGFPRQRALELIRDREALDRGWYAGPIGWMNRSGEGEFVVGIRSALVRGTAATLFAGCGIVADSNPAAEYAESGWKLRPMLTALGLEA